MKSEGGDSSAWREVYEREKQIETEFNIELSMLRTTGRQQHRRQGERPSR